MPPLTDCGVDGGKKKPSSRQRPILCPLRFGSQREDFFELFIRQLGQPTLPCADNLLGDRILTLDHLVDLLFQCGGTQILVDLHVFRLANAGQGSGPGSGMSIDILEAFPDTAGTGLIIH